MRIVSRLGKLIVESPDELTPTIVVGSSHAAASYVSIIQSADYTLRKGSEKGCTKALK